MKDMNLRILPYLFLLIVLTRCTIEINRSMVPEYKGVDPKATAYVDGWLSIAKDRGIKFDKSVSVGFKSIGEKTVIGQCRLGVGFREISIDRSYWKRSGEIEKILVLYHELSHCYCGRDHDYAKDKPYGEDVEKIKEKSELKDGFFKDTCPVSIMFPEMIDRRCFISHYTDYLNEMFDRCIPY